LHSPAASEGLKSGNPGRQKSVSKNPEQKMNQERRKQAEGINWVGEPDGNKRTALAACLVFLEETNFFQLQGCRSTSGKTLCSMLRQRD